MKERVCCCLNNNVFRRYTVNYLAEYNSNTRSTHVVLPQLWNSFHSAVMVTLASFSVMLSVFLLLVWVTCCAKKKFCAKQIISIVSDKDASQREVELNLVWRLKKKKKEKTDSNYTILCLETRGGATVN